jgi:hypothetical protein
MHSDPKPWKLSDIVLGVGGGIHPGQKILGEAEGIRGGGFRFTRKPEHDQCAVPNSTSEINGTYDLFASSAALFASPAAFFAHGARFGAAPS